MKPFSIQALLASLLFFVSNPLFGGEAANLLGAFWGGPSFLSIEIGNPIVANLAPYKVKFSDPTFLEQKGFVDLEGNYFLAGGATLITKESRINQIVTQGTQLSYTLSNLQAYAIEREDGLGQQIAFVDMSNRYAIIGGQVGTFTGMEGPVNQTFLAADMFIPQDQANFLWSQRSNFGTFIQGNKKAPRTVYIFGSPNDPLTNEFYLGFKPYVEAGELSIHWGLRYFDTANFNYSRGAILAILDGKAPKGAGYPQTPAGALAYNEDNFLEGNMVVQAPPLGGILPEKNPSFAAINTSNRTQQFSFSNLSYDNVLIFQDTTGAAQYLAIPHPPVPFVFQDFVDNLYVQK